MPKDSSKLFSVTVENIYAYFTKDKRGKRRGQNRIENANSPEYLCAIGA
jgi:hypothetical protein